MARRLVRGQAGVHFHGDPRTASGAPRRNDIGKCQLQPATAALDAKVVTVALTDDQKARYLRVFPDGVCDWTKPGVGQQPVNPWTTFADGPGGVPLGPPPTSQPLP